MKTATLAFLALTAPTQAAPQIAFTFDDLPAHAALPPGVTRVEVAKATIAALKAAKLPPSYGFVNAALMAGEPEAAPVLRMWREAGNLLGNHTWSHPSLQNLTVADYQVEIVRNEPVLAELGGDWRWFRYPYLSEGDTPEKRTEVRSFLASRGYHVAPATMMFGDWLYSEPYARCVATKDSKAIARMNKLYLAAAEANISYYRAMSQALYGRDISYVLLLHIGAFEARTLPKLIALYKAKGFQFATLERVESDPYYRAFIDPAQPAPPNDLEHALAAAKLAVPPQPADHADELKAMCR
jgi:peptidoglycan/xylan/chitin deacetylase (PgdA/CDA1 family)